MKRKNTEDPQNEQITLVFRQAGLLDKQAALYRLLVQRSDARPALLSRLSGIKRSTVYALLKDMVRLGLVTEFKKSNLSAFRAEHPDRLLKLIELQEQKAAAAKKSMEEILPSLTTQWKIGVGKPVVRYFQGTEGIKAVFEDIYAKGKDEIVGCVGLEEPDHETYDYIVNKLMPRRIRRKIFTRALNSDSPRARQMQKNNAKEMRETFLVDPAHYPLPAEIDVYQNKVAMISFVKGDFLGFVIENPAFAKTLESVFRLLFDLMRQSKSKK